MFCANYDMSAPQNGFVREEIRDRGTDQMMNYSDGKFKLEDEICWLRNQMEELFTREQSFTSDNVIEISILLDLKINEYMKIASCNK